MKESIGNAFIFYIVIIFVFIFIALFVGSTSYTKAFKVKNKIISIIEKYNDNPEAISDNGNLNPEVKQEINDNLLGIGYRIKKAGEKNSCITYFNRHYPNQTASNYIIANTGEGNYDYCVAKFSTTKGNYYAVIAYMYIDIPVIGSKISIPIYGETKVMGILN